MRKGHYGAPMFDICYVDIVFRLGETLHFNNYVVSSWGNTTFENKRFP